MESFKSGKRIFQTVLTAVFVTSQIATPLAALADNTVSFSTANITVGQNETFVLPMNIDNATNLYSVSFYLNFDPTILRFDGVAAGSFISTGCSITPVGRVLSAGQAAVSIGRLGICGGITGSGEVARITMTSLAKAGTSNLTYTNPRVGIYSPTGITYPASTYVPGSVTVTAPADITAPAIAITAPTADTAYTYESADSNVTISGTASDNVGVTQVTCQAGGQNGTANGTSAWSISLALNEGVNVVTVTAADAAGNTGSDTITITYIRPDTTSPVVAITAPTANTAYTYENIDPNITIAGSASDNKSVVDVAYQAGMQSGSANGTANWNFTVTLKEGLNIITVTATDAAGNMGSDMISINYVKPDLTAPMITFGEVDAGIGQAVITWTTDEPADSRISYGKTASYGNVKGDATLKTAHSMTLNGLESDTIYHFQITAADAAGNVRTGIDRTFTTARIPDTARPAVNITGPAAAESYTYESADPNITIAGTASDDTAVTQVTYQAGGQNGTANGTSAWSISLALNEGTNVITVTAADAAGNTGSDTITITYMKPDTTAPAQVRDLAAGNISTSTLELYWTAPGDDPESKAARYDMRYAKAQINEDNWDAATQLTGEPMPAASGTAEQMAVNGLDPATGYYFALRSADSAGNLSAVSPNAYAMTATVQVPPADPPSGGGSGSSGGGSTADNPAGPVDFKATPDNTRIILAWTNPVSADLAEINIYRSTAPVNDTNVAQAMLIYKGANNYAIDPGLINGTAYHYAAIARYKSGSASKLVYAQAVPSADRTVVRNAKSLLRTLVSKSRKNAAQEAYKFNLMAYEEAKQIVSARQFVSLSADEAAYYEAVMAKNTKKLTNNQKYAIASFIHDGTASTAGLGAEGRTDAILAYQATFGTVPLYRSSWQDVVKMANGRWPRRQLAAKPEYKLYCGLAQEEVEGYYQKLNYNLEIIKRNTENESYAVKLFEEASGRKPYWNSDWNTVRTLAYEIAR